MFACVCVCACVCACLGGGGMKRVSRSWDFTAQWLRAPPCTCPLWRLEGGHGKRWGWGWGSGVKWSWRATREAWKKRVPGAVIEKFFFLPYFNDLLQFAIKTLGRYHKGKNSPPPAPSKWVIYLILNACLFLTQHVVPRVCVLDEHLLQFTRHISVKVWL